jgi:Leucine-rich repeat (LRR) protein
MSILQPALASNPIIMGVSIEPLCKALDLENPSEGEKLLQFTSAGNVLGFNEDSVIIVSSSHMLKIQFVNANAVVPEPDKNSSGETSDGTVLPLSCVTYRNLWKGVTVVYEASEGSVLKSTYYLDAMEGNSPVDNIRLSYNRPVCIDEQGNLVIAYENGNMAESAPVAWQEIDGQRKSISVAYAIYGEHEIGFSLGDYVPGVPLVIDPNLTWNSFLGGSGDDRGEAIAVDGSGNVYVTGYNTISWGSPVRAKSSGNDAFVAKVDSNGGLIWNTFLGGTGDDYGYGIAVDGNGEVFVAGGSSANWGSPVRVYSSGNDAFVARLNVSGSLIWNSFIGGGGGDYGYDISIDGSDAYVTGYSSSTWGSPVRAYNSSIDAFAAKLNSSGSLIWNTFLGGSSGDYGYDIALDGSGNIYVTGDSGYNWGSPVRPWTSGSDAFAAELNNSGSLVWNTFLGGSFADTGGGIAVDGSGNVYVAGESYSTWGTPVRAYNLSPDAYVAKLNTSGSLTWNTFLGGNGSDRGSYHSGEIAMDNDGNVYVIGYSNSTWGSPVRAYTSSNDAFAAKLNNSGSLTWNTFLGGNGDDRSQAIAVDNSRNVYITGYSNATWGSPVRAYTSDNDAFAAKIDVSVPIIFPDSSLEAAIRDAIAKPSGDIYQSDLDGLTVLNNAVFRNISDLTGIEHCVNLGWLELGHNHITNISALSGLTGLTNLELLGNQISDISPLSGLINLGRVALGYNQIDDLSPLSGLTGLDTIFLEHNQVDNISALSSLTGLIRLELSMNQISDIGSLSSLTNLQELNLAVNQIADISSFSGLASLRVLGLGGNQISNISALSGLASLQHLGLGGNQISDVSALSGLTSLTSLEGNSNLISDISALSGLINLQSLWLPDNQIINVSALSGLTNLGGLSLSDNQISDISSFAGLTNLSFLDLTSNHISDISPLSGLTALEYLELRYNDVSNVSALSGLTALEYLGLSWMGTISDISPLAGLTELDSLLLSGNQISDITPISGLVNLTELQLSQNQISSVSSLACLTNLSMLFLASNQISDINALLGLTNLSRLELESNQLSDISALSGLINLTRLGLGSNQISNISALSGLTNLSNLNIYWNQISDISALSGLIDLTNLGLGMNQISNISALSGLTSLTSLYLDSNQISEIPPLPGLTSLEDIDLDYNQINNISGLSDLSTLDELRLSYNQLTNVSALSGLSNLNRLEIRDNQISNLSALSGLTGLSYLDLWRNQISNVSPLSGLSNLTNLYIEYNQISDILPLSSLSSLEELYIGHNQISDISGLSNLSSLNLLDLGDNQITDIPALSGLVNLSQLSLGSNQIINISALSGLTDLYNLDLDNNEIINILPLVNNSGLASGDYVHLEYNPLSAASFHTHIPALQARGVTVYYSMPPTEVWVDDNYNASNCGGHTWGYDAFNKIQDGIDMVSGSTVHVASGIYYENIVLKDGVELLGAGNSSTIIDGMRNGSVVTAIGVGNTTVIEGFTITNGSAALRGGGMYNEGSSPVIANCTFESNIAPYGAGICNYNASPAISNCAFNNNSATSGGAMYNRNSASPAINSCVFYNNSASQRGGAIENYNIDCAPSITGCTFQSNHAVTDGGGIHNGQESAPTIDACVFNSNTANYGGGIYSYTSYATMTNCIFNNNSAVNGGGIYNSGSLPSPVITNCNFWNNSASNGGGMYNYYSSPSISNCILWSNNPDGIYNDNCLPSASHSDVQGGIYAGTDNINVDPSFVDAPGGDFHLNFGSPCIDAGENLAPSIPATDFEGDARTINGIVDMGADEYVPPIVIFPDPGLDAAVRTAINKSSGDIYQSDLDGLTSLSVGDAGISDLTGLEHCTNLSDLAIYNNEISDISALGGLTNLSDLDLCYNQIGNITPLSGLTNLQELRLFNNQINELAPLSGLTNLQLLHLMYNQISNISDLSTLTNLWFLDLGCNQISNVSALSGLINLENLDLTRNQISDITTLSGLTHLDSLSLENNQVSDISALSDLTNLEYLFLSENNISNISAVTNLNKLLWLSLANNQISSIPSLSTLTNLQIIGLYGNQVTDINGLSGLTNIREIDLQHNQITDLGPLSGLSTLESLWLRNNRINDITPLSNLTTLEGLYISQNQISNISAVSGLTNLSRLYFNANKINDIQPIVNNSEIATSDYVNLAFNPLSTASINTYVPALQPRGVHVDYSTPTGLYGDANGDGELSIMDYSSVRLMLFGKKAFNPGGDANKDGELSIMDYSSIRLMLFGKKASENRYEDSYDFALRFSPVGSECWAKSNSISALPLALSDNFDTDPDGWVAAGSADYGNIASTNGNVWTITGTPGNYSALQCKFVLGENTDAVTSIGVTLNGSAETNGDSLQFWAWNFNASSWTQIGSTFPMTTDIASYVAWTAWGKVYADYIDGDGYMYILANLASANADLNVDYIKLNVVW